MSEKKYIEFPDYEAMVASIAKLALPFSVSKLHGMMSGYVALGIPNIAEQFLTTLLSNATKDSKRSSTVALFNLYHATLQQLTTPLNLEFTLLLPDDDLPLAYRAQAFGEWCDGFTEIVSHSDVNFSELDDKETLDAIQHIREFADLDYELLQVNDADEQALFEVCEYTRMAVLHLHSDVCTIRSLFEKRSTEH